MNLAISLPLRNQAQLSVLLNQIYDPASPNYHHYLKPEQFAENFGPTKQDYQAVIDFAGANGLRVTATYPNRVLLDVNGSSSDIERAFHLALNVYQHPTENRNFYAPTTEPSLNLSVSILHISGLDNYELPRPRLRANRIANTQIASPNSGSGPSGTYKGNDFRAAYVPGTSLNGSGQRVGLLEFDGYSAGDINYYEAAAGLPNIPLQNDLIDGASPGPNGSSADIEVALDMEVAISMATNLSQLIVYQAPSGAPFEDILNQMAADDNVSQLSCSWYIEEGTAQPAADQIWEQMAAQGQSFFNASGDGDAWTGLIYFPGDSPYITQVGGTTLTTSGPGGTWVSETVWNWGNEIGQEYNGVGSGGGISTQYSIPSYQTNISMTANQGSTTMRNTPDVAMTADNVYVRADGTDYSVGGTSCAAPLWAGFAALVNQQAAGSGHSPIGLINSAVDAIGTRATYTSAFHDITTGNNTWSASPSKFYAVPGYDLCTGWGTPAGQILINDLANPEALIITPQNGFVSMGGAGGPFTVTSEELSLTNAGTNALTWTLSNTSSWLNASSGGGVLMPASPATTVSVSLNNAASNLAVGVYNATLWFTNLNDGFGQNRQFTLTIIRPPTITSQPSDQAVIQGATVEFTVNATGGLPLSYQWQFNNTNLTDGENISGSMTTNLIIQNVCPTNVGNYTVVVTNLAGVAISSNAALTITPSAPVIVTQPASQTAVVGETATFNASVIGTRPFYYQWTYNGSNIDNATNSSLALTDVQLAQSGTYAVTVTNTLGSTTSSNATLSVYAIPVITSFSPVMGAPGTVVNVSGFNFSPIASNNIVYFGAVQAVVSNASPTNLVVSVPVSATYARITETVNGLTAYAPTPFLVTFSGSAALSSSSFASSFTLGAGQGPIRVIAADMDGDGKPDLVVANDYEDDIYVYRNIGTNDTLSASSFAPPVELPAGPAVSGTDAIYGLAVGDLTGDGRLDIVVADRYTGAVSIYQNLCTPGVITTNSFGTRVDLPVSLLPTGVAIMDMDGDGRPDLVTANINNNSISILRNLAVPGALLTTNSFAAPVNFSAGVSGIAVALGDLDGDGKPDVVMGNSSSSGTANTIVVMRNLSTPGNLALAAPVDFAGLGEVGGLTIGDIDGDGKPDVVMGSSQPGQAISVYRNTSTPGSITTNSLAAAVSFGVDGWASDVAIADLDGDGKPDLGTTTQLPNNVSLFRNLSTPGSFTTSSLGPLITLPAGYNPNGLAVADLTGDGRPDLIFANSYDGTLAIAQNITPLRPFIVSQPTNETVVAGGVASFNVIAKSPVPLSYQWNFNTTNLLGATNAMLTLTDVQPANAGVYYVTVTDVYGSTVSSNALLTVLAPPIITVQPTNQTISAANTAVFSITANGTPPLSYQWIFNGSNSISGATNSVLVITNAQFANEGSYSITVTNPYGSVTSSNAILVVTVDHFDWNTIPSPRFVNYPFSVKIIAEDAANGVFTNYAGVVFINSTNGLPLAPTVSSNFAQGIWTGTITLSQTATNLVLSASDGSGHIGLANPIDLVNSPSLVTFPTGGTLYISWPVNPSGFSLETSTNLSSGNWIPLTAAPLQFGDVYIEPITPTGTSVGAFYRLYFTGQ